MKLGKHGWPISGALALAVMFAAPLAASAEPGNRDQDDWWRFDRHVRFGDHPTLPVPGALVFGGIAVAAAGAAARRRKSKDDKSGTPKP